jgi:hypothetical protein
MPCKLSRLLIVLLALAMWAATPARAGTETGGAGAQDPERAGAASMLAQALGMGPAGVPDGLVLYEVGTKGPVQSDLDEFRSMVAATLHDPRGWSLGRTVGYLPVRRDGQVHIWLASPAAVDAAHPVCSARYSCRVDDDVYINDARWRDAPATFVDRSLDDYRHYVINHEFGHWLGLKHRGCRRVGAAADVMQQQSISLDGCHSRLWPRPHEQDEARRNLTRQGLLRPSNRR